MSYNDIKYIQAFIIASRKIPRAINAPMIAPITATTPLTTYPANENGAGPMNERIPANQRNKTPTINPITIKIAPTALLLPDPK